MKLFLSFGLGVVSGFAFYRFFFHKRDVKNVKGHQENVYTIARRIPLIIDNGTVLEHGVCNGDEMLRILDADDNVIVPSGTITFHEQTENDFTITFSNGYSLQADEDTIFIVNTKDETVYESALNYEDMNEFLSKISMNSPVFDRFYDFIQSRL